MSNALQELSLGSVAKVTSSRRYFTVQEWTLEPESGFEPSIEINGCTVMIYAEDVVIVLRSLESGRLLICRYAGKSLCVIDRQHLTESEALLS
mgnify:CR=1 FL=1